MRQFKIPFKITKFDDKNVSIINQIIGYLNRYFIERPQAPVVVYTTNMNTDVGGEAGDIVRCSTDNKFYGCTVAGSVGNATWVAFN